nr:unnamed protein product [Callosobruchus chinensis]
MKRKNNVVISGLKIDSSQNEIMCEDVKRFLEEQVKVKVIIPRVMKINEHMHVAEIDSFEKKLEIMKYKGKVDSLKQNKNIYICSDLTKKERQIQKCLRDQAIQERNKGKVSFQTTWKIQNEWRLATWNVREVSGKEVELSGEFDKARLNILGIVETKKKGKGLLAVHETMTENHDYEQRIIVHIISLEKSTFNLVKIDIELKIVIDVKLRIVEEAYLD